MRYFLDHWQMYRALGLKVTDHLPSEGMPEREVTVRYNNDGSPELTLPVYVKPPQNGKHRVIAICNCGKHVPFGRLGQHRKGLDCIAGRFG